MKLGREDISIIYFNKKEYSFSMNGIFLSIIAGSLCTLSLYLFLDLEIIDWLKEIVAKQTSFF